MDSIEYTNSLIIDFLNKVIEGSFDKQDVIISLENLNRVTNLNFNIEKITNEMTIFYKIHRFLNLSFDILEIKDNNQNINEKTFSDMLLEISTKHCHTETKDDKCYKCVYHKESLICHLFFAMFKTMEYFPTSMSDKEKFQISVTTLLHDVGKFGCLAFSKFKNQNVTAFPFHGEYGAGILIKLWHNGFSEFFDKESWENSCRSISVHMCGYSETNFDTEQAEYKMNLLRTETQQVKKILYHMSFGDKLGAWHEDEVSLEPNFIVSRQRFKDEIEKDFDFNKFKKDNKLYGTIIQICGMSSSGKSTFIKKIIESFLENGINTKSIEIVERDMIMFQTVCEEKKILFDGIKLFGEDYKEYYSIYKKKELSKKVNKKMFKIIGDSLLKGKIVIVDTVASYFNAFDAIFPPSVVTSLRISIDISRNKFITEQDGERLGLTLQEQIKAHGNVNLLNWLCDGSLPRKNSQGMLPLMTSRSTSRNISKIDENHSNRMKPHLRFQVSWNNLGYTNVFNFLQHLSKLTDYENGSDNDEDKMDIVKLIEKLYTNKGYDGVKKFFIERKYTCSTPALFKNTNYEKRCFYIKYLEHCNIFDKKFSRQGRGSIFFVLDSGKVICLKNLLQRGIEYLTGNHIKNGISENENVTSEGNLDYLDEIQRETIRTIVNKNNKGKINGWMSFKNDGSLSGWTLYPITHPSYLIMSQGIDSSNDPRDEFSKVIFNTCRERGLPFLPVLSSSGTLTISEAILSYNVTSICCGLCDINYETLCEDVKNGMEPVHAFVNYALDRILANFESFWSRTPLNCQQYPMCLSFEAIVPFRVCAWKGFHPELAVSYEKSSYNFLGCMFNIGDSAGNYRAHFQLEELICLTGWKQPMSWKVDHVYKIETMSSNLDKVIRDEMTEQEFLAKHPPFVPLENENVCNILDYEGFVFYVVTEGNIGLINQELDFELDYGKIKTVPYYISHKINEKNIEQILSLPQSAERKLPLVSVVKNFYPSIRESLITITENARKLLIETSESDNDIFNSIPDKGKITFRMRDFKTQCKMIINIAELWHSKIFLIFQQVYSCFEDSDEMKKFLKIFVMEMEIWNDNYIDKVTQIIDDKHDCIKKLLSMFLLCNKTVIP